MYRNYDGKLAIGNEPEMHNYEGHARLLQWTLVYLGHESMLQRHKRLPLTNECDQSYPERQSM